MQSRRRPLQAHEVVVLFLLVAIAQFGKRRKSSMRMPLRPAKAGGILTEAAVKPVVAEPATERFIEIMKIKTNRVVTVIEVVSLSNKRGAGLKVYRKKRRKLLASDVNVVEIDLVRKGNWKALLQPHTSPAKHETPYRATLRFAGDLAAVYLIPIPLRQALPKLPIPLRKGDAVVFLDVQPLVNAVYERGRCEQVLDYDKPPPEPAITAGDVAWCEEIVRHANLR
jgi:Protein of unknown function (DUF4058)